MQFINSNLKLAYFIGSQSKNLIIKSLKNNLALKCNHICHKSKIDPEYLNDKSPPFPYLEKKYRFYDRFFEGVAYNTGKFDENTKVVIVDGNVGSGKSVLAKKLADELGMKYFPDLYLDIEYIREDGFDLRSLNKHLPVDCQYPDIKTAFETKHPIHFGTLQYLMFKNRYYNYISAFAHMVNTGEGVVLERSPWSDMVFAKQFFDEKLYSKDFLHYYLLLRSNALTTLIRPHLIIYLDVPTDKCLIGAKEKNSFNVSEHIKEYFLKGIEKYYKEDYLKIAEKSSELLICKSNNYINEKNLIPHLEYLIEEIENIDFDYLQSLDANDKLFDWNFFNSEKRWQMLRKNYTWNKKYLLNEINIPSCFIDEVGCPDLAYEELRNDVFNAYSPKSKPKNLLEFLFGKKESYLSLDRKNWFHATGFVFS